MEEVETVVIKGDNFSILVFIRSRQLKKKQNNAFNSFISDGVFYGTVNSSGVSKWKIFKSLFGMKSQKMGN